MQTRSECMDPEPLNYIRKLQIDSSKTNKSRFIQPTSQSSHTSSMTDNTADYKGQKTGSKSMTRRKMSTASGKPTRTKSLKR